MTTVPPEINVADLVKQFSCVDYIVFISLLWISAGIGLYYAGRKIDSTKDYLMAGKSMTTFPVAMSLLASFKSAVTLLGIPSEVYTNGVIYWLVGFAYFFMVPVVGYLYVPIFIDLQMCLYMAIAVYAPALALSLVTGLDVYLSVTLIMVVCSCYTSLGGMKAVLWTDMVQVFIMYAVMAFIVIKGAADQGGFMAVWNSAKEGGRAELINFDIDPTTRHTLWTLVVGGFFNALNIYGVNQAQVQRYLCVKEKKMAMNALWINFVGLYIILIIAAFGGLVIHSKYQTCDPLKSGLVSKADQLLPFFVMDTLSSLKGVPGLFVAGVFSGSLSTVSSGINALAAVTLEDFIKIYRPNISEKSATIISKALSFAFGLVTYGLVFVVEQLGDILALTSRIFGMIGGPICGVFTLGMLVPWANSIGACVGMIFSLCFTFWIGIGYQVSVFQGKLKPAKLPVDVSGCTFFNSTDVLLSTPGLNEGLNEEADDVLTLYKTSYLWYSCIGFWTVIAIGTLVSFVTGARDIRTLNPKLLSPLIHWIKKYIPGGIKIGADYVEKFDRSKKSESCNEEQLHECSSKL